MTSNFLVVRITREGGHWLAKVESLLEVQKGPELVNYADTSMTPSRKLTVEPAKEAS